MDPKFNMTGVLIRKETEGHTHKENNLSEAEIGMMHLQVKEWRKLLATIRSQEE